MKKLLTTTALMAAFGFAASAWAQCPHSAKQAGKTTADKQGCAKTCGDAKKVAAGCDKSKCGQGCGSVPKLVYKVGDETTCCSKTADKMAKDSGASIKFVVAGKEYSDQGKAYTAYADALETRYEQMTELCYMVDGKCVHCPKEAGAAAKAGSKVKYCVASVTFDDKADAEAAIARATKAAGEIKMTTTVDGKPYCCAQTAAKVAKDSGKCCEYSVGDCKTKCETTARAELAKARIDAFLKAVQS